MIKYIIIILVIILYKKKIFSKGKYVQDKFSCSTIAVYWLLYYFKPFREFCLNN